MRRRSGMGGGMGGSRRRSGIAARQAGINANRSTAQRLAGVGALDRARVGTKTRMDRNEWRILKARLIAVRGDRCEVCGTPNVPLVLDHTIPHAQGGSDHPTNLKLKCHNCDKRQIGRANRKGAKLMYG